MVRPVIGIARACARKSAGNGSAKPRRSRVASGATSRRSQGLSSDEALQEGDRGLGVPARDLGIEMQAEGVERGVLRALCAEPPQASTDPVDLMQTGRRDRRGDELARDEIARREAEPGGDLGHDAASVLQPCFPGAGSGCRARPRCRRWPIRRGEGVRVVLDQLPAELSCSARKVSSADGPTNSISTPTVRIVPRRW